MRLIRRRLLACFLLALPTLLGMGAASRAASTVPRYGKFEASFTLPAQTGNPFDPRDNAVDVVFREPQKQSAIVPAFWDGDHWRVRFAPTRVGVYTLTVTRNGQPMHPADLSARRFQCVPSSAPGFVRRDPKIVQRFVLDGGDTYYPLGMDVAWTGGSGPDYPAYFAQMGTAHMNWARVWMTYWDGKALEWSSDQTKNPPRGYFLMDAARRWDRIFDEAEKNGVYVQMVLQHHGQYTARTDPNWSGNPFNTANGGFLAHPDDFFTDPEARRLTRAKYRYIVARWGYATHLLSYELFNEVQNIGETGSHFQDVVNWHKEMAACIRSLDTNHHLITTSNSVPGEPLAQIGLDYDQIHAYPPDIVTTFASVKTVGVGVPVFYGEWGPGGGSPLSVENLHDGLWASLMAPTAGAGQYWSWDEVMKNGWWPQFASATGFVRTFGLARSGALETVRPTVDAPGARATLSFAPPGGWEPTTRTDVTLDPDGRTPDLSGVASFIQGRNHRDMLPKPINFHLDCAGPCQFIVTVGTVAKAGAQLALVLDGGPTQAADFPASEKDHDANQVVSIDVPAGVHTVSLFNPGQDWFVAKQLSVTDYSPAVAVLARGNTRTVFFWAYSRDRHAAPRTGVTVALPGLPPGRYTLRLWDTAQGQAFGPPQALKSTGPGGLTIPLPPMTGDIAGAVTASRS